MAYVREKRVPGKDGKVYRYYQLVEGKRVDGKVRQHVIKHLGRFDSIEEARASVVAPDVVPNTERDEAPAVADTAGPEVVVLDYEEDDRFYRVPPHILKGGDETLRKLRRRLRAVARDRNRRYAAIVQFAKAHGFDSLDAEEWAKAEEIREEAEHLSGEADELTAELKRRRLSASG